MQRIEAMKHSFNPPSSKVLCHQSTTRLPGFTLTILLCLASVSIVMAQSNPQPRSSTETPMDALVQTYFDASARLSPVSATNRGDHRFDGLLDDVSAEGRAARLALTRKTLTALNALEPPNFRATIR